MARVRVLVAARVRVRRRLGLGLSGGYFRVRSVEDYDVDET